jgi:HSP20 family protein
MLLSTWDPFRGLDHFERALGASRNGKSWTPATNIVEDEKGYALCFDLPGMSKEDIDINVEKGMLEVSGERRVFHEENEDIRHYRMESQTGRFRRSFRLPDDVDAGSVTASYKDGVLEVRIARLPAAQARKVAISDN